MANAAHAGYVQPKQLEDLLNGEYALGSQGFSSGTSSGTGAWKETGFQLFSRVMYETKEQAWGLRDLTRTGMSSYIPDPE